MHNERLFKKGSYIFIEGDDESSPVYLVKKGRVSHVCSSPGLSAALKDAGPGDFFGFISAFSGRPRLSSAVAVEDTVAVRIESEHFFSMLHEKNEIAIKIMGAYSHALKKYDSVLMGIKPISLLYPPGMNLLRLGEYYMDKGENRIASYIFNRYVQLYPDSENINDIRKYTDDLDESLVRLYSDNEKGEFIYNDGSVIFCEYEPGDMLYFIEEGRIKIFKQSKNSDILLAVLGPGEIFGELALITNSPRSATAVSFGGVRLTPVDMDMFKEMLTGFPDLIRKIIKSISQRLWFNHVRLSQMSYRKAVTRLFAFLETKLMEDGVSFKRKTPHQLQFGLDELIEMNDLSPQHNIDEINELVNNRYLSFNFGTITVTNPQMFAADVQLYKQRDVLPSIKNLSLIRAAVHQDLAEDQPSDSIVEEFLENHIPAERLYGSVNPEIAEILPSLNDEDPSKRVNAVIRLGNLGEIAREYVPFLKERLADDVKIIRRNAARSIINILPGGESFKIFRDALNEKNNETRSAAAAGLGDLNVADRSVIINLLFKLLDDHSTEVKSSTIRSLGNIGYEAEPGVPRLVRMLSDKESSVRILTVNALEKITGYGGYLNEVIMSIKALSKNDPDKFVRSAAKDTLIKLNRRKKHP